MNAAGPHRIRLRGPWRGEPLARTVLLADGSLAVESGEVPPPGELPLPGDWSPLVGGDFRGRVRFRRHFHRPTGLAAGDRVRLVIEAVDACGRIELNGHFVGEVRLTDGRREFDISSRLELRNELVIDVDLPRETAAGPALERPNRAGLPGGLIGLVALEIDAVA